jgi:dienelactone hydrolase
MVRRTFPSVAILALVVVSLHAQQHAAGPQPTLAGEALGYPKQTPLAPQDFSSCRGPEYSEAELRTMAAVVEVPEVRRRFPGSYMFVPAGGGTHPGVIFFHGSGGGRNTPTSACTARVQAARGYASLAFCYFDCGDDTIPEALADVDLKRSYDAMVWLKRSPWVNGRKVAMMGASRGAEKAALLASLIAHAARKDPTIVVPDLLYSSATFGRVVGAFNWRDNPKDYRWQQLRRAHASCLRADPTGPYQLDDGKGGSVMMQWDEANPACRGRPALAFPECWRNDADGKYVAPSGRRRTWLTDRCAATPTIETMYDRAAWTWSLDPERARPGADIQLQDYQGPILVAHGAIDELWSVADGPDYLKRTLEKHGIRVHREVIPKITTRVSSWRTLPGDRVQFYIFDDEPHAFSPLAVVARRELYLAFFDRVLK